MSKNEFTCDCNIKHIRAYIKPSIVWANVSQLTLVFNLFNSSSIIIENINKHIITSNIEGDSILNLLFIVVGVRNRSE